jgi:hypothetical protein
MSNILRRIRKLESRMTDRSGCPPHSKAWLAHWKDKLDQFLIKRDANALNGMPLAALDDIIEESKHRQQTHRESGD